MIPVSSSIQFDAPRGDERQKLAEAATRFEAIFARQMLAAARKAGFGDELFGSAGGDTFRQMMDERFADLMAESGTLGFGKSIEAQLSGHLGPATGEETKG